MSFRINLYIFSKPIPAKKETAICRLHTESYHSISFNPRLRKYSLALLKCWQPKNLRSADKGAGWEAVSTQCRCRSKKAPFFCVSPSKHKHDMLALIIQIPDHHIRKSFPPMRSCLIRPHRQNNIPQQDTLFHPTSPTPVPVSPGHPIST